MCVGTVGVGAFAKEVGQSIDALLPGAAPVGDPRLGVTHGVWFQPAGADPAGLLRTDQATGLEHLQVLDHRGQGHGKRFGQLADRGGPLAEAIHNGPAGGVGEGLEEGIEPVLLLKHMLKHSRTIAGATGPARATDLHFAERAEKVSGGDVETEDP
jgi:hypothetical protein